VWVHREGLELLQRRFPVLAKRVASHRLSAALARGLARMARIMEAPQETRRAAT
jgi:hypothetical protein